MYAIWDFIADGHIFRSGPLTALLILVLLGLVGLIYHERGRGHVSRLKQEINGPEEQIAPSGPQPGGLDPMTLTRQRTTMAEDPEFASATLLPGLGMGVLQITAYMPGGSEVPLLFSPGVEWMAAKDRPALIGPNDLDGAFELPWAGVLTGVPTPAGDEITARWRNTSVKVPATPHLAGEAVGGLLPHVAADRSSTEPVPGGTAASGTFQATDFHEQWPGTTQAQVAVTLEATRMEFTVSATNMGTTPEPMGIGWHPRFATRGDRRGVIVKLPQSRESEMGKARGLPTGKIVDAGPGVARLMQRGGGALGGASLDALLVEMKPGLLEDGAIAEMRFPAGGYGLRMTVVSPSIRAMRVYADPAQPYVSVGPQTNYDDPLGREWEGTPGSELSTLSPGQTLEWKVKLQIFPLTGEARRSLR